jgi:pyridoxamine 5'-phosphate oxidase
VEPGDLDPDPIVQFRRWLADAEAAGVAEPGAMVLATATPGGSPSARYVLLRGLDERGFAFFTNYQSAKAGDLEANPRAALVFGWDPLHRQVRVTGLVERVAASESDAYFASRARGSQIGAWASPQSGVLADRAQLEGLVAEANARFPGEEIPRPAHWGGYRVRPEVVELWQGRQDRLHDRLRYRRDGDGWAIDRLAP